MKEWDDARGFLAAALAEENEIEVRERVRIGLAQLWLGEDCAMVTEVVEGPRRVHVWLAGGRLGGTLELIPGIAAWARAMGCTEATVNGRKGWKRALRPFGFSDDDVLRKVL